MKFNNHYDLEGLHAFLGASKYHWVNYSDERFEEVYRTHSAAQRGTLLHEYASNAIKLGIKQSRSQKTLNMYINDAIGFRMNVEQPLFYSINCFGTADSISFRNNKLRIHDLKTGVTRVSMKQLEVYTALFCLEYRYEPSEIETELRIYKDDEVLVHIPDPEVIKSIMSTIARFDKKIDELKEDA